MKTIFPLTFLLLLSACGIPPDENDDTWNRAGYTAKHTTQAYERLLAEQSGWRVWEIARNDHMNCIAVKPAKGKSWPNVSENYKSVSGGAGFFMYFLDEALTPYYGFYGGYPYRWPSIVEVDGHRIADTNSPDTVIPWEGKEISFSIDTQPSEYAYKEVTTATGTVDFSGVTRAHEVMRQCHSRATRS